jgi:hypothetical protein
VVFAAIERNPQRYPKIRGEIRRALVQRFPHAVYYVADPDQPRVIACTHNRRHPRRWQSRR